MKKYFLGVAFWFAFSASAFAEEEGGLYLVGMAGNTSNISNAESGSSLGGLIGYKLNSFFAVEAGMNSLVNKANYLIPPVGYTGVGSTYTSTSLSGSEFAAIISLPLTEDFSILLRMGYTSVERTNNPSPAEVEVNWKGATNGLAVQYLLPFEFSVGKNKMQIGLRAGYNRYSLTDATGLLTEAPTNNYVAGVIQF